VDNEQKRAFYQAKVKEAEQNAQTAPSPQNREHWLNIARGYRYLLRTLQRAMRRGEGPGSER
jgi:hypothetical protein